MPLSRRRPEGARKVATQRMVRLRQGKDRRYNPARRKYRERNTVLALAISTAQASIERTCAAHGISWRQIEIQVLRTPNTWRNLQNVLRTMMGQDDNVQHAA